MNYVRPRYYNENTLGPTETIEQVFENEEYLPSWFNVDVDNLKVVVDIGAMIGSFSLWAAQKFPKSTVYCYEPDPESFEFLKKNIEVYNLQSKIKAENVGVWNKEGKSTLYRYVNTPSCNSLVYDNAPGTVDNAVSLQISTKSISDIIKETGSIDFLKMDCEGSEYDILYSLTKSQLDKIRYVALEYHDFDNDPQKNSTRLLQFLRDAGFAAQKIPTDMRKNRQVGYLYADRTKKNTSSLNSIFDGETKLIEKYLKIPTVLQEKLALLEHEFDDRSKWALELDKALKERDSKLAQLQKEFEERSKWALELDKALKERDSKLAQLQKEFEERSKWALELDKALKERDSKLAQLQKELVERSRITLELDKALKERDSKLAQLQKELVERSRITLELDKALKERDSKLAQLQREFDERSRIALKLDKTIKELETEVNSQRNDNKNLENVIQLRDLELDHIKQSFIFKRMKNIALFVDKTAPKGTTRREILRLVAESVRIIHTNGWLSYFKECGAKLNSMSYKIRKPSPIPEQYLKTTNIPVAEKGSQIISCNKKLEPDMKLRNFMQYGSHDITNLPRRPLVSIIIPTYNAVDLLKSNLESIESLTTYENYEIIIVTNNLDPNSPTRQYLEKSKYQVLIYQKEYSFSSVNNFAAKKAKGEFLLFLNDDIKISSKNWLEAMLKLGLDEEVGAVGAKLLFPDGKLQEAGGIIWKNGSGWNYGRDKDPQDPKYNFVRDVDYCSASCLMVKKKVFDEIGGFDERFKLAYGEDSDLCFAMRKHDYRILYQPLAEVIHFEGSTQGTDVNSGIKSQQLENQKIFCDKWKDEIKNHYHDSEENSHFQSYRKLGLHILYIDHYVPEYDKDAGSVTAFNFICILASMGHKITFWPDNLNRSEPYTTELQQKGVEVIYGPNKFEEFIEKRSHVYAVCIMARPHIAIHFIDKMKEYAPKCKIIYEASDLHYVRIFREADIAKSEKLTAEAEASKKAELELMSKSHLSLFRGEKECAMAINENKSLLTAAAPLALYYDGKWKSFDERQDMVFVGGYTHPPNVDAVEYFILEIFPIIRNEMPDVKFHVIGSNVPEKIRNLCANNKNCVLVGYIPDISNYLLNCRVMVAPLRYGAGVKGKITQSMMYHLPVVTTAIGAEGISEKDDVLLISDDPKEFAKKVIGLYRNKELWNKLVNDAYEFANIHYSPESVRDVFAQAIGRLLS